MTNPCPLATPEANRSGIATCRRILADTVEPAELDRRLAPWAAAVLLAAGDPDPATTIAFVGVTTAFTEALAAHTASGLAWVTA